MENQKKLFKEYQAEKESQKVVPEFDLVKYLQNYKRNVDFYNSYGLKPKPRDPFDSKRPLGENNS